MTESKPLALLEIERELSAKPDSVFSALTQPEKMSQWFYGMDTGYARAEADLRVGGKYKVSMYRSDDELAAAPHGEYLEIDPPSKLVFTWTSEGYVKNSIVTIILRETEKGTHLHLKHELPEEAKEAHNEGWTTCAERLETFLKIV